VEEVFFLDINRYMLEYAKFRLKGGGCFAHVVQADIDHMTFRSGVFDVVLAEGDSLVQRGCWAWIKGGS